MSTRSSYPRKLRARQRDTTRSPEYADFLQSKISSEGYKRKGERTRDSIKMAAATLLNEKSYRDLRISDICERASVAPGTFYLYFKNKMELTKEVLAGFVEMYFREVEGEVKSDPFDAIYSANWAFLRITRANAGLARCLLLVSDEEPEFARLQQHVNVKWYIKVARGVAHRMGIADHRMPLFIVHALGSMMDEFVRRMWIWNDRDLIHIIKDLDLDDEALCECLSVIWYRTLYGNDPPRLRKTQTKEMLNMRLAALSRLP